MTIQSYPRDGMYCEDNGPLPLGEEERRANVFLEQLAIKYGLPEEVWGGGDDDDWPELAPALDLLADESKFIFGERYDAPGNYLQQDYEVREWKNQHFIHSFGEPMASYHHLVGSREGIIKLIREAFRQNRHLKYSPWA